MLIENHVNEYVELKRALGYKFTEQEGTLRRFAQFADGHGDTFVTVSRVVQWASMAPSPRRSAAWLSVVRNFAITLHSEDNRHDVPSPDIFGRHRKRRPRPHILSQGDVRKILQAAPEIGPHASINPYTYHYLFGLAANPAWWWTIVGPLSITGLFLTISLPLIEERAKKRRRDWAAVCEEVPLLVPRLLPTRRAK